jgi:taurine transport system permease protein
LISLASVLVVFVLWSVSTALQWVNPLFLPSPAAVWTAFVEILHNGYKDHSLGYHIFQSMYRLVTALLLSNSKFKKSGRVGGGRECRVREHKIN